jgi:hypothetical protein
LELHGAQVPLQFAQRTRKGRVPAEDETLGLAVVERNFLAISLVEHHFLPVHRIRDEKQLDLEDGI